MTHLSDLQVLVQNWDGARKFVKSLIDERQKLCATHTSKHFTAGCVADSRGEGMNAVIKEGI